MTFPSRLVAAVLLVLGLLLTVSTQSSNTKNSNQISECSEMLPSKGVGGSAYRIFGHTIDGETYPSGFNSLSPASLDPRQVHQPVAYKNALAFLDGFYKAIEDKRYFQLTSLQEQTQAFHREAYVTFLLSQTNRYSHQLVSSFLERGYSYDQFHYSHAVMEWLSGPGPLYVPYFKELGTIALDLMETGKLISAELIAEKLLEVQPHLEKSERVSRDPILRLILHLLGHRLSPSEFSRFDKVNSYTAIWFKEFGRRLPHLKPLIVARNISFLIFDEEGPRKDFLKPEEMIFIKDQLRWIANSRKAVEFRETLAYSSFKGFVDHLFKVQPPVSTWLDKKWLERLQFLASAEPRISRRNH